MQKLRTRTGFWSKKLSDEPAQDQERAGRLMAYAEEFEDRWFWETDVAGRLTYLSRSVSEAIELFGVKTVGQPITSVFAIDHSEAEVSRSLSFHLISRTSFSDYPVRGVKGLSESWWSMSGCPAFDADGNFRGFVGSGKDLTKSRKQDAIIRKLAHTDSLTGLANRQHMRGHLDLLMKSASADEARCALLMLDLDGFKSVNDTLGHPVGDALLIQVANRLSASAADAGIVGRLGGDEFQILVPRATDGQTISRLATRIIEDVSAPYEIDGSSINVSCSIGIAVSDLETDTETLVRNADIALYAAKEGGRATYRFFEDEMLAKAKWRKELEDDLRRALGSDQFRLVYQPIVATGSEDLTGFEALLRWEHPSRGEIGPSQFIPIAEESGLIQPIGDWVLRTAIEMLAMLPPDLRIAVNVSPLQFSNPALLSTLASALGESQIDPARLELEITESVFLEDEAKSQKVFKALKALGVRLALDDFGTGYSSLSYLQHTPFDKIKIDQSFVKGAIDPRSRNAAIIQSIVTLSNALEMETTAEGVQYQDEIKLIRKLGCSHIQGYVYGCGLDLRLLMPELQAGHRQMRAVGPKRSRSARTKLLRNATIFVNELSKSIRIRNISDTGALIESVDFTDQMIGVNVSIEVLENKLLDANVRWVSDDRAGIEFDRPISLEDLDLT